MVAPSTTPARDSGDGRRCRSTIVVVSTSTACPCATRRRTSSPAATTGPPNAREGDHAGAANTIRTSVALPTMPVRRKPRLLVLNQYYWPGIEATAQLLTDLCEALTEDVDVKVITGVLHGHEHEPR